MESRAGPTDSDRPGEISSFAVLGARMTWVFLGPLALVLVVWGIVSGGNGWFTVLDALFVAVVGWMILGRWVEQRSDSATTLTGAPATIEHCKRYTVLLLIAAVVVWIAANAVGNHVLT